MPFRKMKWPKSEEKPKLGVGGVCHGDAVLQMYRSHPPQCQTHGAAPECYAPVAAGGRLQHQLYGLHPNVRYSATSNSC